VEEEEAGVVTVEMEADEEAEDCLLLEDTAGRLDAEVRNPAAAVMCLWGITRLLLVLLLLLKLMREDVAREEAGC